LKREGLKTDHAAGLAGELEHRVENPACNEEGGSRDGSARAIDCAIVGGHPDFAGGDWEMDLYAGWTGLRAVSFANRVVSHL
jgi:hypothetical protein